MSIEPSHLARATAALGAALVIVGLLLAVLPDGRVGTTAMASPMQQASPCVVTHRKTASPDVVLLGEDVTVTLSVQAQCPPSVGALHVVLVLDASGSMAGSPSLAMKQAAARFVRQLQMPTHPIRQVGVVEYNEEARRLSSLTNDESRVIGAINRVSADGGTRIDLGILEGLRVLSQGRSGINRDELTEVIIVLADGGNNAGCQPILAAARQAKSQGVLLVAICFGSACDEQCMRQVASGPRYYFRADNAGQLVAVFDRIAVLLVGDVADHLTVTDTWGDRFAYVAGSANPAPESPVTPTTWLRWVTAGVPPAGATHTLRLRPLRPGTQPANEEAQGVYRDAAGRPITFTFRLPSLTVLDPTVPTATPSTPPPATATADVTVTATPAHTATPTDEPPPEHLILLPSCTKLE